MTAAGLAAALVLGEIFFRLVAATPLWRVLPVPEVALYAPDPHTGYRHRVGAAGMWLTENRTRVRISSLGLRDRERPAARGAGPRVVVLGNSLIEALQVDGDRTSSAVAERLLREKHPQAEAINLGLAGASPAVIMARLQSEARKFTPDAAVVFVPLEGFFTSADDSAFPAYRRAEDGAIRLSHGFRNTRGHAFRTSAAGRAFYWLLDHSMIATLVNNRKNVGLLAELPTGAPAVAKPHDACSPQVIDSQRGLWLDDTPAEAAEARDAFLRDLAEEQRRSGMRIIAAVNGVTAQCPALDTQRAAIMAKITERFDRAGVAVVDVDAELVRRVGGEHVRELYGFGTALGGGHLNERGNAVYGAIIAESVERALPRQTP